MKSKWTEGRVAKYIKKHFQSHKYALTNSYVFSWESDFFSMTPSGFAYEVEIKVTKSDFKADSKKVSKHRFLSAAYAKSSTTLLKGALTYEVKVPIMEPLLDDSLRRVRDEKGMVVYVPTGRFQKVKAFSNSGEPLEKHKGLEINIISTAVNIVKHKVPNRFFYAVPEGLITKEEVPAYAGLLYVTPKGVVQIKAAPLLHSVKMDLTKILLDKFYYLTLHLYR